MKQKEKRQQKHDENRKRFAQAQEQAQATDQVSDALEEAAAIEAELAEAEAAVAREVAEAAARDQKRAELEAEVAALSGAARAAAKSGLDAATDAEIEFTFKTWQDAWEAQKIKEAAELKAKLDRESAAVREEEFQNALKREEGNRSTRNKEKEEMEEFFDTIDQFGNEVRGLVDKVQAFDDIDDLVSFEDL